MDARGKAEQRDELSLRTRLALSAVALLGGTVGFRLELHAAWWLAVALGTSMAAFYVLAPEQPRGRAGMALSVAVFAGLGGWGLADLGAWSLVLAAVGSASFLGYCALEDRRGAA